MMKLCCAIMPLSGGRYKASMSFLDHLFSYLNRLWVRRESDEGRKKVDPVYTVRLDCRFFLDLTTWFLSAWTRSMEIDGIPTCTALAHRRPSSTY
jgi:hypothetical protein